MTFAFIMSCSFIYEINYRGALPANSCWTVTKYMSHGAFLRFAVDKIMRDVSGKLFVSYYGFRVFKLDDINLGLRDY